MKFCPGCKKTKALDEFGTNKTRYDGKQANCKSCRNTALKIWYAENKDTQVLRVQTAKKRRKIYVQDRVIEYLKSHPCVDCYESDVEVLDFDHVNPQDKTYTISRMISSGMSWHKVYSEIKKCDVRCANCHRRRTGRQFGWYKVDRGAG